VKNMGSGPKGLSCVASNYDVVLCDIWGVLHNGLIGYKAAEEALSTYRAQGGHVILISNTARPAHNIAQMLSDMGISSDCYDAISTSGDATRELLHPYTGRVIHHIGPVEDAAIFDGLQLICSDAERAEAVVVTDLTNPQDTPQDYTERMDYWFERGLPMICANPDKYVEVGDRIEYCPGALADIYQDMGGQVKIAGKPHASIYAAAFTKLRSITGKDVDRRRILAIGDSVRTDATGAARQSLDFFFITGSIHAAELEAAGLSREKAVSELVGPSEANMVAFALRLGW